MASLHVRLLPYVNGNANMAITYNEDGTKKEKKGDKIAMDIFPGKPPKDVQDQLNEPQDPKDGSKILKRLLKKIRKGQV